MPARNKVNNHNLYHLFFALKKLEVKNQIKLLQWNIQDIRQATAF